MLLSRRRFAAGLLCATALSACSTTQLGSNRKQRPNIITIVLDDVGFSDIGCYGGEIRTPNIDRLAARGLRFNRFDTKAVCSATQAALLTGRNGHTVNFPDVPDMAWGDNAKFFRPDAYHLPGYIRTSAQVPQDQRYATWLVGKWHLIPLNELAPGTSRNNWPLQRGFDYFYGFARGWTDQYKPDLVENDDYLKRAFPCDYHLTADLVDKASSLVEQHAKSKGHDTPFFLQLALGVAHSPIQVPKEWADKYTGVYDVGWDVIRKTRFERMKSLGLIPKNSQLPPRDADDRAWESLSAEERIVFARYMEVYAGFIEHADTQIGKLLDTIDRIGMADNTMVVFLSDNGSASEAGQAGFFAELYRPNTIPVAEQHRRLAELGTPATQAEYPRPWAIASSAPFRRYKLWPFLGGVRTPLIVSWPRQIPDPGSIREQYVDVIDIGPTLLAAAGTAFPPVHAGTTQISIAALSILSMFNAPDRTVRTRQYFELRGHRALTDGRWRAVAIHNCTNPFTGDQWQLFDTVNDFTESHDLAAKHPEIVARMRSLWNEEWRKHVAYALAQPAPNICHLNDEYDCPTMKIPDR